MGKIKRSSSFTLIELLVVIVIIGILAGVITISTSNNIAKAQDSKVSSVMLGISKLLKTYSMDTFPIETTPCNIKTGCTNLKSKIDIPNIDQDMYYKTSSSGNFFVIYANKPSDTSLSFEINSNIEKVKEVPSFDNLVAYYPLSIGTKDGNTISDMSPNSNHGTNNGATFAEGVDGNMNTGMRFDGVNDYVIYTNLQNAAEGTIAVWAKVNATPTSYKPLIVDDGYGYLALAIYPDNYWGFTAFDTIADWTQSSATITMGTWYHVVGTYKTGEKRKLYINGNLDDISAANFNGLGRTAGNLKSGKWSNNYFNGTIDDVRIYNRALSEPEIKTLYNSYNSKIQL